MDATFVISNATIAPICASDPSDVIPSATIVLSEDKIAWLGADKDCPESYRQNGQHHDAKGACVTPGLIDCHSHLVYGGERAHEFAMRLEGADYGDILKQGGGILSTVNATRTASEDALYLAARARVQSLMDEGVTTLEIKSGYGLDEDTELKILRVVRQLSQTCPIEFHPTLLAAHALPPEFTDKTAYIDWICQTLMPKVAEQELAAAVDIFCEPIAFDLAHAEKLFKKAQDLNLAIKCHAEQLSASGAAALAARYGALSIDHGEYLTVDAIEQLADAGTVVVLLPGAYYFLREQQTPPVSLLREHQVPMAVATDSNPGTSPGTSLLWMMNMACVFFGLTPFEALAGVTCHAARALGWQERLGSLKQGLQADLLVWPTENPEMIAYAMGQVKPELIFKKGKLLKGSL
jgi:imidazolonepropionase